MKHLNEILGKNKLEGSNETETVPNDLNGFKFSDSSGDAKFVAKHPKNKHEDRVGNTDEPYIQPKIKPSLTSPAAKNMGRKNSKESESVYEEILREAKKKESKPADWSNPHSPGSLEHFNHNLKSVLTHVNDSPEKEDENMIGIVSNHLKHYGEDSVNSLGKCAKRMQDEDKGLSGNALTHYDDALKHAHTHRLTKKLDTTLMESKKK